MVVRLPLGVHHQTDLFGVGIGVSKKDPAKVGFNFGSFEITGKPRLRIGIHMGHTLMGWIFTPIAFVKPIN